MKFCSVCWRSRQRQDFLITTRLSLQHLRLTAAIPHARLQTRLRVKLYLKLFPSLVEFQSKRAPKSWKKHCWNTSLHTAETRIGPSRTCYPQQCCLQKVINHARG